MNTFHIIFTGIMLFLHPGGGPKDPRDLVIPLVHGMTYKGQTIADHQAYIAVTKGKADYSKWGSPDDTRSIGGTVHELFYLSGDQLAINAADSTFDATGDASVPSLSFWCAGWTPGTSYAKAGTMHIDKGVLTASGDINKDEASVSALAVTVNGSLVIVGTNGGASRQLTIAPGADVRIENTEPPSSKTHSHFLVYYAISANQTCDAGTFPGAGSHKAFGADCSNGQYP